MNILTVERKKLYDSGLTDQEIADTENITRQVVASWRSCNKLPNNKPRIFRRRKWKSDKWDVNARPEHERVMVGQFMAALIRVADSAGITPDQTGITNFMKVWRSKVGYNADN